MLLYLILYSSLLSFSPLPSLPLLFSSSSDLSSFSPSSSYSSPLLFWSIFLYNHPIYLLFFLPSLLLPSFKVYVSVLTYTYLYSLLINNSTPHKLTDGNVEWCSAYLYRVVFWAGVRLSWCWCFVLMLTYGVILYYILYYTIIYYTYTYTIIPYIIYCILLYYIIYYIIIYYIL